MVAMLGPVALAVLIIGFAACDAPFIFRPATSPPSIPNGATVRVPWALAKISSDQRRLIVGVFHPEIPPRGCREFRPFATVDDRAEQVTLAVSATVVDGGCGRSDELMKLLTVELPSALADRRLVDGYDGAYRPPLPERLLPRLTYPQSAAAIDHGPATGEGERLAWTAHYGTRPGVGVSASRSTSKPPGRLVGPATVDGHDAWIYQTLSTARGSATIVAWQADGWTLWLNVAWAPQERVRLDEVRRIIAGLTWD